MNLNKTDREALCEVAKNAALKAGKIIRETRPEDIQVKNKEGGENLASQVVTEIDLACEKIILETLRPTIEQFDLGLLAEESENDDSRFHKDYFWCIDPLDGTLAFSRDEDGYSTSIALVSRSGESQIGVVYNPREDALYSAIKGMGAQKNELPLLKDDSHNCLTLLFDQSYHEHERFPEQIKILEDRAFKKGLGDFRLLHLGGAVMNGLSTIEFGPAVYYKFPKKAKGGGSIWDFAASSVIQREAGGFNSDFFKNSLDLNRVDSSFMNHKGIIFSTDEKLSELFEDFYQK